MNFTPQALSRAIVEYLGAGSAASPRQDEHALRQMFGDAAPQALSQIASLLREADRIEVDWSTHTLQSAGDLVRSTMQARHPELSDEALNALEWKFTFDWR